MAPAGVLDRGGGGGELDRGGGGGELDRGGGGGELDMSPLFEYKINQTLTNYLLEDDRDPSVSLQSQAR